MRKKRIYISGKITDNPSFMDDFKTAEIQLARRIADGDLKEFTSVVNPAVILDEVPSDFEHKEYMEVCIALLNCCGAIYMLDNYKESKGAQIELSYAKFRGMKIFYERAE